MAENDKKYDGDYKIQVSDKGNISFTLNWKWLIGIAISTLGFVGWLLIDKYYVQPMNQLQEVDTKVEQRIGVIEDKLSNVYDKKFEDILKNQGILLDRTERMTPSRSDNILPNNDNTHLPFDENTTLPSSDVPPSPSNDTIR